MINQITARLLNTAAFINPATGEKPLSTWVIVLIVLAGLAVLLCALYPILSKASKKRKK